MSTYPGSESQPKPLFDFAAIIIAATITILLVAGAVSFVWWVVQPEKSADLQVTGFDYSYDWWDDSIHVWGTVANDGNGWTEAFESIVIQVTVWFDGEPYAHEVSIYCYGQGLGPGESKFFEQTWSTPYTLDYDVSCYARLGTVTWYND